MVFGLRRHGNLEVVEIAPDDVESPQRPHLDDAALLRDLHDFGARDIRQRADHVGREAKPHQPAPVVSQQIVKTKAGVARHGQSPGVLSISTTTSILGIVGVKVVSDL